MASTETCLQITSPLVQPGEHRLNECYYESSRFLASSLQLAGNSCLCCHGYHLDQCAGCSRAAKTSEAETAVAPPLTATAAKAEPAPPQAAVRSSSSSAEGSKSPAAIQPSAGGGDIRHVHGDAAARPAEPSAAGGVEAPSPAAEVPVPVLQAAAGLSAAKHTDADAAAAARERYLARKRKASGNTSAT